MLRMIDTMKKHEILKILAVILIPIAAIAAANRTIKTEVITSDKSNQDITITPTGTGDVVLKDYTGFLNWATGTPTAITSVDSTEFQYLDGVTSAIQTQLNAKLESVDLTSDVTGVLPVANGGTGSASQNFVDLTTGQTVAGTKTFSADTLWSGTGQIDLPVGTTAQRSGTPNSGMLRFNSDTTQFEGYDGTDWGQIGGGGAGGINYLDGANSTAEPSFGDWICYVDTAGENAVDGTGGTCGGNVEILSRTATDLRGTKHFDLSKNLNLSTQGYGASVDFTIDEADQAKTLTVSFDYKTLTNYEDGFVRVQIYDVTNSKLIRVNGEDLLASSVNNTHYARFQAAPDSTSYRLILHIASTSIALWNVYLDNISVGPQVINHGTIVTDWEEFTPDWTGATANPSYGNAAYGCYWRRVGGELEVSCGITMGTTTTFGTGEWYFGLPSGLTIDTNLISANTFNPLGLVQYHDVGTSSYGGYVEYIASTYVRLNIIRDHVASAVNYNTTNIRADSTTPMTWTTSDQVFFKYKVPIAGWSSQGKMSSDFGGRDVVMRMGVSSQNITSGVTTNIDFDEVLYDTAGTVDLVNDKITIPESGFYHYTLNTVADQGAVGSTRYAITCSGLTSNTIPSNNTGGYTLFIGSKSGRLYLTKGTEITCTAHQNSGSTSSLTTMDVELSKIPSAQTMLENELVAARYTTTAGASISNTTTTIIDFDTISFDTHNAVTTGASWKFTAPVSGKYHVGAQAWFASGSWSAGTTMRIMLYKNGVLASYIDAHHVDAALSSERAISGSDTIDLNNGDYIDIRVYQNSGGARSLNVGGNQVRVDIKRIK